MRYLIHTCLQRHWYVKDYLIPSMTAQGIPEEEIQVWLDTERKGNLASCIESFRDCGKYPGGTWHLCDDVVICRDFAARTKEHDSGIVCGYAYELDVRRNGPRTGDVSVPDMWWSFPCIRIPNRLAEECADWITWDASHREMYRYYVDSGKHDDYFWMEFLMAKHRNVRVLNLAPALVDHIDYLIGGSVINRDRGRPETRTAFWEDHTVITELEEKLKNDKRHG